MNVLSSKSFIVSIKKMNEADLLIVYVTEDYGKIACFANNARKSRKRFLGKLEPAMLTNIKFYEKAGMSLAILYEVDSIEEYKNIRKNIDAYISISKMLEITKALVPEKDKNVMIFNLLRNTYLSLDNAVGNNCGEDIILKHELYFISNFLKYLGIFPNFTTCTLCSQKNIDNYFAFSIAKGGAVCNNCAKTVKTINLSVNAIKIINLMVNSNTSIISKLSVKELVLNDCLNFLENILSFYAGNSFKSFQKI
ncbi:MAG: DNA repair protein RecO [Candidatus Acididesulfobacter diazotrophicus]|uniref:DNA repair protein RecO n=1 Tax=Candidatus Acididesulfobacter diazotrophicus TaxID=2597226 RepID=A0A519BNL1_9DELT|nr:MAG: DNA repair protein RecO [Candidatus Acididesulfobacter diazotrophicus]